MTTTESGGKSYLPSPRSNIPGWVWGLGACACLPIAGIVALGMLAAPQLKRIREANRDAGRTRTCLANVRQSAIAMQTYAQDYDDRLPPAASWMDASAAYAEQSGSKDKTVFHCPAAQVKDPSAYGYAFNTKFALKPISKITNPAVAPLLYDSTNLARNASDAVTSLPSPGRHRSRRFRPGGPGPFNIMGYADGHAKSVSDTGKTLNMPGMDTSQQ